MANKVLLLAATSALMLASCSNDEVINNGVQTTPPHSVNLLNLNKLSVSSQGGRIKTVPQTKGVKAERLMLVAKVQPVKTSDENVYNWSASSVALRGDKAFVTWHSNRQASNQATMFGGALDVIDYANYGQDGFAFDFASTFVSHSLTSDDEVGHAEVFKFNNIISTPSYLYIAGSGDKNGAMVARLDINNPGDDNRVVSVPGSSANAMIVDANGNLKVVTGYSGGAYYVPAENFGEALDPTVENQVINTINVKDEAGSYLFANTQQARNFGGKFITDNYILRTDESQAALISVKDGTSNTLDAPLLSSEKYGESFDDATDSWKPADGPTKAIYGKHNFAELDGYVYVAAGTNGLRVYKVEGGAVAETAVWDNGIFVNAVCAFNAKDKDGNDHPMIAAATGNGLRIYRPYNDAIQNREDKVLLYAYEVDKYDENGVAESTTAAANGHSANYIAVDENKGLIFVAYGQTGVNIYKLDESLYSETNVENLRQLIIPAIANTQTKTVENPSDEATFLVPKDEPTAPEGKKFVGWKDEDDNSESPTIYKAGDEVTVGPGKDVTLVPIFEDDGTTPKHTVTFDLDNGSDNPQPQEVEDGNKPTYPTEPTKEGYTFEGWTVDGTPIDPENFVPTADVTIKAVWTPVTYKYKLVFAAGKDGANGLPDEINTNDATVTIPTEEPTLEGWTFRGWYTENLQYLGLTPEVLYKNGSTDKGSYTFTTEGAITLYAIWTQGVSGSGGNGGNTGNNSENNGDGGGASDTGSGS